MKLFVFTCLIVLFSATSAQSAYSQSKWGIEAGVNFSNIKGDDAPEDLNSRSGLLLAAYYQYSFKKAPLIFQPEILYTQKGFEFDNENTAKLNYVAATGLIGYYYPLKKKVAPFLKAGPYVGYNIIAKEKTRRGDEDIDNIEELDAGFIIRAGVQIERFEVGARFSRGLTNVFEEIDAKNSLFGIFVGAHF